MSDKPKEKPTVDMPRVPEWAIELTRSVKTGFATLGADIALVSNDLGIVKDRVGIIETWKADQDARANNNSVRAKQASQVDMEQASQLEALATEVASIKAETSAQTLLLSQLLKLTEKPVVKLVATAIGTAILTWLTAKGLR